MNVSVMPFTTRMRSAKPSWAQLFVEVLDAESFSKIDVEWLPLDETIVLQTEEEPA